MCNPYPKTEWPCRSIAAFDEVDGGATGGDLLVFKAFKHIEFPFSP